jgi:DNA-binding LacI/PurR family transcriptional regulator
MDLASLSYKYQRVRERLRQAVEKGEMMGKLPGERELSRRYGANPKTINKALTDLATEGLLVRHIGRGTFVARSAPAGSQDGPAAQLTFGYLVPAEGMRPCAAELWKLTAAAFERRGHSLELMTVPVDSSTELSGRKLSADRLRAFDGLALFGFRPSSALLASTSREHVPLVMVNNQHGQIRTAAVLVDYAQGAFELCQHLIYLGYNEIRLCVDPAMMPAAGMAETGYRAAMQRNGLTPGELAGTKTVFDAGSALAGGDGNQPTGVICVGSEVAASVMKAVEARTGGPVSVCCIPEPCDTAALRQPITTYEVKPDQIAQWVADLLTSASPTRWQRIVIVPGTVIDRGSTCVAGPAAKAVRAPGVGVL